MTHAHRLSSFTIGGYLEKEKDDQVVLLAEAD